MLEVNMSGGNYMDYMPFVWLAVMVLAVIMEMHTTSLVAIWFMPAALLTVPFSFFLSVGWQILIFLALSAIFIVFSRFIFKKTKFIKDTATNVNALIGQSAVVTERIRNLEQYRFILNKHRRH